MLSNKSYDVMKWVVQLVLPALATLYFTLSGIWDFPYGEEVVGTIAAITAFLGVILRISSSRYNAQNSENENYIYLSDDASGEPELWLNLAETPAGLEDGATMGFKVKRLPEV